MTWTIGKVRITSIFEMDLTDLNEIIWGAKRSLIQEIGWLVPHFATPDGQLKGVIQCFVVETPTRTIVVDTCIGDGKTRPHFPHWHMQQTGFLERFRAAGFDPAKVDCVLCTHMHVDHVGWNTRWDGQRWVPTFPNARYLFAKTEFEHWAREREKPLRDPLAALSKREAGAMGFAHAMAETQRDSIDPIVAAGLADFVETDHRVCDEVRLLPTPGHTPGHVSIAVSSEGLEAVITGDCVHHPCQIARPGWFSVADHDNARSTQTRQELFAQVAKSKALLIGTHFAVPTAGHLEPDGDGFILKTDQSADRSTRSR